MKKLLFAIIAILLLSCDKKNDTVELGTIEGKWLLTEIYSDPGDGSGKFRPTDVRKILEFKSNKEVFSYGGNFCDFGNQSPNDAQSAYSVEEKEYEGRKYNQLKIEKCNYNFRYEINGDILTIYYQCIEGCGERYKRGY